MEATAQYCFVKVLDVKVAQYSGGIYKEVHVMEETGFWLNKFRFNIFPEDSLFASIETGITLSIKVDLIHSLLPVNQFY